jgi:hypothetical protein
MVTKCARLKQSCKLREGRKRIDQGLVNLKVNLNGYRHNVCALLFPASGRMFRRGALGASSAQLLPVLS